MKKKYVIAKLFQDSTSSNLPFQRNQQGRWEEVSQRLLDHCYEISGQL
jgi:hypothetical protein